MVEDVAVLVGGCHCGALRIRFAATRASHTLGVRVCSCSFCEPRRLRWTSDPRGSVEITIERVAEVGRYRFGTETADVVLCRRCGFILAAVTHAEPVRAVVNVDALDQRATFAEAEPIELGGESVEARLERRAGAWTPATVTVAG